MRLIYVSLLLACAAHAQQPSQATTSPGSTVLLERGALKVTAADFEAAMTRFPEDLRLLARAEPETILKVIDGIWVHRVLAAKAIEAGIDKDPLVQLRAQQVREGYLAGIYLEKLESGVKTTNLDGRARELYLADPSKYKLPATVAVNHVVISHMNRTPEMALARAKEARAKLLAGTPVAAVSKEYSDAPGNVKNTGEQGEAPKEAINTALVGFLFSAPLNTWSEPIVTPTATHLVLARSRKEERIPKFEEVKSTIVDAEIERLRKRASEHALTAARTDPANTIYRDRVEALKSDIDPAKIDAAQRSAIRQIESQK